MLKIKYSSLICDNFFRQFSTSACKRINVALCGASGGIGQPLSLLLKRNKMIEKLHLYDLHHALGVSADLSHIDTPCEVKGYQGQHQLHDALKEMDIIIIAAGVPRKPGMTRDDLFKINADIVKSLGEASAQACPKALVAVISNPLNSLVPLFTEVYKIAGVHDPKRIFGVTSLDIVRAKTFISEILKLKPHEINVDVIGGHSGNTIIPVLSRVRPSLNLPDSDLVTLTERIQEAGTEIVKAKEGTGSATLSMAHAAAEFVFSLCRALEGEKNIIVYSYVASDACSSIPFFATPIVLGKDGIEKNLGIGKLSEMEEENLQMCIKALKVNIKTGIEYALKTQSKCKKK